MGTGLLSVKPEINCFMCLRIKRAFSSTVAIKVGL